MKLTYDEIEETPVTIEGLCDLAERLNEPQAVTAVGNLYQFLKNNPGAIEAVIDWASDEFGIEEPLELTK